MKGVAPDFPVLSICIVAHNGLCHVGRAIGSSVTCANVPLELIVVDNGSTDGTANAVRAEWPFAEVIQEPVNRGYAPAMNRALLRSRGRYLLLLSQDAEASPESVETLLEFMEGHPTAGLAGPRTVDDDGRVVTTLHHPNLFLSLWTEIIPVKPWLRRQADLRRRLAAVAPNSSGLTSNYEETHPVPVLDGGCLMVRRRALEKVGLLDPMLPQGPDDYDWCYRMARGGFELWYVATAVVVHRARPKEDAATLTLQQVRLRLPQWCYLYAKYHRQPAVTAFRLSALLLLWKWRRRIVRLHPEDRARIESLCDASRLCWSAREYRRAVTAANGL